jgi:hypothetical protein
MEKSLQLRIGRRMLAYFDSLGCPGHRLTEEERCDCIALLHQYVAELAADEEVAVTLKRGHWNDFMRLMDAIGFLWTR